MTILTPFSELTWRERCLILHIFEQHVLHRVPEKDAMSMYIAGLPE